MSRLADQRYLLAEQYRDASNLEARQDLHRCFSTSQENWFTWVFNQIDLPESSNILELGAGPGVLWEHNRDRIPSGWQITLSDLSPGMVEKAQAALVGSGHPFSFAVMDAQDIPIADCSFDAVMAHHMLYHVPDRARALCEIRRVLLPGGHFYAATNGEKHMVELRHLLASLGWPRELWDIDDAGKMFGLESGYGGIRRYFEHIEVHRHPNALAVTEVEPIVRYVLSAIDRTRLSDRMLQQLVEAVEDRITTEGSLHITKDAGIFIATKV
ncbi:MAG: hypothetical protein NVS2B16_08490 [Chloroflexota bacterium]